jgi:CRP/FNR family transcriptional regulator, cyclic AMP receptor protein
MEDLDLTLLQRVELLRATPADDLAALAAHGRRRTFAAGSALITQGQVTDAVYVILTGRVRVERTHPLFVQPVVLTELAAGRTVGEIGVLDATPHPATALAVEDTETLELEAVVVSQILQRLAGVRPDLARALTWRSALCYVAGVEG